MNLQERITKKQQQIAKMERNLTKYFVSDEFTAMCERYFETDDFSELKQYKIDNDMFCLPDYYSKARELNDARKTLAKYEKQLEAENAKNATLAELPEVVVEFKEELIKHWDAYDIWKRDTIKKEYRAIEHFNYEEYRRAVYEMRQKWGASYYEFMDLTNEQIHAQNIKDADALILNMINRTVSICGKITDCKHLYLDRDNSGYSIINGTIIGENGKAKIESILAGGYNIQRLHVRVLVKEVK